MNITQYEKVIRDTQEKCPHVVHFNVPRDRFEIKPAASKTLL